jgi:hypothetical protein
VPDTRARACRRVASAHPATPDTHFNGTTLGRGPVRWQGPPLRELFSRRNPLCERTARRETYASPEPRFETTALGEDHSSREPVFANTSLGANHAWGEAHSWATPLLRERHSRGEARFRESHSWGEAGNLPAILPNPTSAASLFPHAVFGSARAACGTRCLRRRFRRLRLQAPCRRQHPGTATGPSILRWAGTPAGVL